MLPAVRVEHVVLRVEEREREESSTCILHGEQMSGGKCVICTNKMVGMSFFCCWILDVGWGEVDCMSVAWQ